MEPYDGSGTDVVDRGQRGESWTERDFKIGYTARQAGTERLLYGTHRLGNGCPPLYTAPLSRTSNVLRPGYLLPYPPTPLIRPRYAPSRTNLGYAARACPRICCYQYCVVGHGALSSVRY
eukprot:3940317-Rhodomonas_salina.1